MNNQTARLYVIGTFASNYTGIGLYENGSRKKTAVAPKFDATALLVSKTLVSLQIFRIEMALAILANMRGPIS
ncbi:MAG: hypothetical protein AAB427_01925, partial [Chloroflexota bacterium]